jgi:hypothetical protein
MFSTLTCLELLKSTADMFQTLCNTYAACVARA